MQKIGTQLNLRSRIIAVLLAALMVVVAFVALPPTSARAITPTGNEDVWNEFGFYSLPVGGLYTFETEGFVENSTVEVRLTLSGAVLGEFDVDGSGVLEPNSDPTSDRTTVIISETTSPGPNGLSFFYKDGSSYDFAVALGITLLPNNYSASFKVVPDSSGGYVLQVDNNGSRWASNTTVTLKIDWAEEAAGSFVTTDAGSFTAEITLPNGLSGTHTFTLLAPAVGTYLPASVNKTITF
jgi:hypothetical protein